MTNTRELDALRMEAAADGIFGEYKYVMVCIQCEKTYRSLSGIDDRCHRCQGKNRKRNIR